MRIGVSLEIVVRLFFYIVVFSLTNILFGYKSGGHTDCIDELIFKVINAPTKRMKIEYV